MMNISKSKHFAQSIFLYISPLNYVNQFTKKNIILFFKPVLNIS